MKKIIISDWNKVTDEFFAFMFGLDDAVERSIIRYLFDHAGWNSFDSIRQFCMVDSMICFNQSTLSRRLTSLVNFGIIERRVEHDNRTFYKLSNSLYAELLVKKEGYF